jgi:predicted RNA binding protein YcfA (HicA-like mRNA interferase family)
MPQLRKLSGQELIKILCNKLGFKAVRKAGSHVILIKETSAGKIGTVVPIHEELKIGTILGILRKANLKPDDITPFL